MLYRVKKLYIIFGFCVVCIRSISVTSLERLICKSDKYNSIRGCIGTFILPNVVLTTSNCAENCDSVGKLLIVRTFIHPHYRNYVLGTKIIARNDIAIVVTENDNKRRKLMKLSALDNLSAIGLKALVPIMDDDKPRLAVAIVERCYKEQPFGYYVCASNRVTPKTVKVCRETQEQGVPLLLEDRIFGIMGITHKDKCKLPQRIFTAVGPALYWISNTVRHLGYDEAVITTLHDMTSTQHPHPSKLSPQPTTTPLIITTKSPSPTTTPPIPTSIRPIVTTTPPISTTNTPTCKTNPPIPTTTPPIPTTTPPIPTTTQPIPTTTPPIPTTTPPIPTLEEHYNTYPAKTSATLSTRIYSSTINSSKRPKPSDLQSDDPPPRKPFNPFDSDHDDHHIHLTYPPPYHALTNTPPTFDSTADSHLIDSPPKFFKRYTALDIPPTFPEGFTIDPSLITKLRQNKVNSYLAQWRPPINHSYVSGITPKGSYPSIPNAFGSKVIRLLPKQKTPNERKKYARDYFLKAHKSLKSFNIANTKNDFIIQDSPVALPLTLNKPPIMRTQKILSTQKSQTKKVTAITFVPIATSSRTRAETLSKPKQTTKLTNKSMNTTVRVPFFKVLENNKTTNIMDWFNIMVKDKLKNQTAAVFYVATTTTTEAYSPLSSQRPLNFIDLT